MRTAAVRVLKCIARGAVPHCMHAIVHSYYCVLTEFGSGQDLGPRSGGLWGVRPDGRDWQLLW